MYFWYFLVVVASMIENSAIIPFTCNWTLRIAKAPPNITISDDAPLAQGREKKNILKVLEEGFNTRSTTIADNKPYTTSHRCFYVVIS